MFQHINQEEDRSFSSLIYNIVQTYNRIFAQLMIESSDHKSSESKIVNARDHVCLRGRDYHVVQFDVYCHFRVRGHDHHRTGS